MVPLAIEHEIHSQLPRALSPDGRTRKVARDQGALRVDSNGDGELDRQVSARSPQVVGSLILYHKRGAWYAAPATLLKGTVGGRRIELLDVDLDGRFGTADYVRWDKGSFYRQNDTRLAPTKKGSARYQLRKERDAWVLELTSIKRPAEIGKAEWRGLVHLNLWRSSVGLAPLRHNATLSEGCQKHADYLQHNGNDANEAGGNPMGVHGESADKPGYTKEGLDAAKHSNIVAVADPVQAIDLQTPTMLHRVLFLAPHDRGLGIGVAGNPDSKRAEGYAVIRTGAGLVSRVRDIVVVPAPGQRKVPILAKPEFPVPEKDPGCYQRKPGYPVSVTFGTLKLKQVSLKLFRGRDGKVPVSGFLFTPAQPVHSSLPNNNFSAFFLPKYPLRRGSTYLAVFEARLKDKRVRLVWSFQT